MSSEVIQRISEIMQKRTTIEKGVSEYRNALYRQINVLARQEMRGLLLRPEYAEMANQFTVVRDGVIANLTAVELFRSSKIRVVLTEHRVAALVQHEGEDFKGLNVFDEQSVTELIDQGAFDMNRDFADITPEVLQGIENELAQRALEIETRLFLNAGGEEQLAFLTHRLGTNPENGENGV